MQLPQIVCFKLVCVLSESYVFIEVFMCIPASQLTVFAYSGRDPSIAQDVRQNVAYSLLRTAPSQMVQAAQTTRTYLLVVG